MEANDFPISKGLQVQAQQLREWRSILKPEKYTKLLDQALLENQKVHNSGYDVWRGTTMQNWIMNNLIERQ